MCGLAGFIGQTDSSSLQVLKRMTAMIRHRGPDGEGFYLSDSFALGHRRLAILDLSSEGAQPMTYLDRYIIIFNGEIYNYKELRNELLEKGYKFNTHTDTEVLAASFHEWSVNCLQKLNGMWAFVILDKHLNKFFMARDRFGVKPLYYLHRAGTLVFASEVKSILEHPLAQKSVNTSYLISYLKHGAQEYIKDTFFRAISKFPPAKYFYGQINEFSEDSLTTYWQLRVNTSNQRFSSSKAKQLANEYYEILYDAVKIRLRSDVPVGAALSGGLDSSSIVYILKQLNPHSNDANAIQTFSSVYKNSKGALWCDESKFIDLMAVHLNVKTNKTEPQSDNLRLEHANMIIAMENPPDSTCMSGWHVFKKVSESNIRVTLDGQGADEQLTGYGCYYSVYMSGLPLKEFIIELIGFLANADKNLSNLPLIIYIVGKSIITKLFAAPLSSNLYYNPLNDRLAKDFQTSLVNYLHYSDRVSMAHSIESRAPFMDYRLVEFLASVPACYKIHSGWSKYIARLAFSDKLPHEICWRKDKKGWLIPERQWFRDHFISIWRKKVISSSRIYDKLPFLSASHWPSLTKSIRILNAAQVVSCFYLDLK